MVFDLISHLYRQRAFSRATFGPGHRTNGVIDRIKKELVEIEESMGDGPQTHEIRDKFKDETLAEWVDVILLALDGAWRTGASPEEIVAAIKAKQDRNERRDWPDWRTQSQDKAITHIKAAS